MSETDERDCFRLLLNFEDAEERLVDGAGRYSSFADYWEFHNAFRDSSVERDECSNLRIQLAEKGVQAERELRILLNRGLDTLNELMDSSKMTSVLERAVEFFQTNGSKEFASGLAEAKKALAEHYSDIDFGFIDEAINQLEAFDIDIKSSGGRLHVGIKAGDDDRHAIFLEPQSSPGERGRVSTREFFRPSSNGSVLTSFLPGLVADDCHHKNQLPGVIEGGPSPFDIYGGLVGSFAMAKEGMYRHVRNMQEIGIGRHRGGNPIVAIVIILAVVAAALIVAGATIEIGCAAGAWNGSICDWGWFLILAGLVVGAGAVCVALGECTFVVALSVAVPV
jgi:hypothetical protein